MSQRTATFLQLTLALAALLLLAAGMGGLRFEPGNDLDLMGLLLSNLGDRDAPAPAALGEGQAFPDWMRYVFWLSLIFVAAYAIVSPDGRRRLFMTLVLVVLLLFIAERYRDRIQEQPRETDTQGMMELGQLEAATLPQPPPFITDPPSWLFWTVNGVVALAFFLLLWFLWRKLRPQPDPQELLADEAASALAELEAGGDVRDVVLRCYVQMGAVLKESYRIERRKAVTPREFESQLAAAGIQDEHIRRLTRLFEGVRYGSQNSSGKAAQEASDCLQAIVQVYGRAA